MIRQGDRRLFPFSYRCQQQKWQPNEKNDSQQQICVAKTQCIGLPEHAGIQQAQRLPLGVKAGCSLIGKKPGIPRQPLYHPRVARRKMGYQVGTMDGIAMSQIGIDGSNTERTA